jgi:hypothetical protein
MKHAIRAILARPYLAFLTGFCIATAWGVALLLDALQRVVG